MTEIATDKRAAILEAMLNLIAEHGFHDTPMSLVAQQAGVGVGTIYRYFANKEEVINALYRDIKGRVNQALTQGYDEKLPVRQRFNKLWSNFAHYYANHPRELRFVEQYSNSPFINSISTEEGFNSFEPVMQLLKYGQEQEIVKEGQLEILTLLVYGGIVALVKFYLTTGEILDETVLSQALDNLWDAVKR